MTGVFLLTVPLAAIAAVMAWIISYDELSRHYPDRGTPASEATLRAVTVLLFFLGIGAVIALVVGHG
jgi:hypothetical protein